MYKQYLTILALIMCYFLTPLTAMEEKNKRVGSGNAGGITQVTTAVVSVQKRVVQKKWWDLKPSVLPKFRQVLTHSEVCQLSLEYGLNYPGYGPDSTDAQGAEEETCNADLPSGTETPQWDIQNKSPF